MVKKSKNLLSSRFNWKLVSLSVLAIVLIAAALEATDTIHLFHRQKPPVIIPTSSGSTKTQTNGLPDKSYSSSSTPPPSTTTDKTTGPSDLSLIAPYGTFVSNHHPSNATSFDEVSYCYTAPSASCYIKFTNLSNGDTTRLASQTTGSDGSTSWSWNVNNDARLGNGDWQITAIASLNGQTKSTTDSLDLKIGP